MLWENNRKNTYDGIEDKNECVDLIRLTSKHTQASAN